MADLQHVLVKGQMGLLLESDLFIPCVHPPLDRLHALVIGDEARVKLHQTDELLITPLVEVLRFLLQLDETLRLFVEAFIHTGDSVVLDGDGVLQQVNTVISLVSGAFYRSSFGPHAISFGLYAVSFGLHAVFIGPCHIFVGLLDLFL